MQKARVPKRISTIIILCFSIFMVAILILMTVSYTHLDVYKRQLVGGGTINANIRRAASADVGGVNIEI